MQVGGQIESADIKLDSQFLGRIGGGSFTTALEAKSLPNGFKVGGAGSINLTSNRKPRLEFEFKTEFPGPKSPSKCLVVTCAVSEVDVTYLLDVDGGELYGTFKCPDGECFLNSGQHFFETVNTAEFFKALSNEKIFSPLYLGFAYSQMMQGDKTENGHTLSIE